MPYLMISATFVLDAKLINANQQIELAAHGITALACDEFHGLIKPYIQKTKSRFEISFRTTCRATPATEKAGDDKIIKLAQEHLSKLMRYFKTRFKLPIKRTNLDGVDFRRSDNYTVFGFDMETPIEE